MSFDSVGAASMYPLYAIPSTRLNYLFLTEEGGLFFNRMKIVAGERDLGKALGEALDELVAFFSSKKPASEKSIWLSFSNDEGHPIYSAQYSQYPFTSDFFVESRAEAKAFIDLVLPEHFFKKLDQLLAVEKYESKAHAFMHVSRYALWRLEYKKSVRHLN